MAAILFPSFVYNATQPAQIVASQAAFNALPGTGWAFTPFPVVAPPVVPSDPGFINTDTRLQQQLVEMRMLNAMFAQANGITDDPQTMLRPDYLANDSGIAT